MRPALIVGAGAFALAGLLLMRSARAAAPADEAAQEAPDDLGAAWGAVTDSITGTWDMTTGLDQDTAARNVAAFLLMIRTAEGTADAQGYRALFGHRANRPRTFSGYSDHPRIAQQFTDGTGARLWTTAAGAYQFMARSPLPSGATTRVDTWDRLAARLGLPDFSPASQDAAAVELIRERGALADVRAGRFDAAVSKVRGTWASLPGAGYAQPERSIESLRLAFINAGGTLA